MKHEITTFFKSGRRYKSSGPCYNNWWLRGDDSLYDLDARVDVDESTVLLVLDSREVLEVHKETAALSRDVKVLTQKGLIGWLYLKRAGWVEIPDNP
jgi:hypothetical protein